MRIVSLNVGLPREIEWHDRRVRTSIFKSPADRRLRVTTLNLEGDQQSDFSVHGGVDKAVYAYPSEHYQYWHRELPQTDLPWGVFGENLTIEGLLEEDVRIGDHLRVGSAKFVVTQPWSPRTLRPGSRSVSASSCVGFQGSDGWAAVAMGRDLRAADRMQRTDLGEPPKVCAAAGAVGPADGDEEALIRGASRR